MMVLLFDPKSSKLGQKDINQKKNTGLVPTVDSTWKQHLNQCSLIQQNLQGNPGNAVTSLFLHSYATHNEKHLLPNRGLVQVFICSENMKTIQATFYPQH